MSIWTVKIEDPALKQLGKLDGQTRKRILRYLEERVVGNLDPRRFGKGLSNDKAGL